jgi:hypothetical protein
VGFPYIPVFLALLLAYMVYSQWARLDSRYPIAAALVLLVATAGVDAAGATATANTLAEFVFFLLAAGIVLLLLDHARSARPRPAGSAVAAGDSQPADPPHERQGPTEEALDRPEQEPVALVDRPGQQHDEDEQGGDADPDHGERP